MRMAMLSIGVRLMNSWLLKTKMPGRTVPPGGRCLASCLTWLQAAANHHGIVMSYFSNYTPGRQPRQAPGAGKSA